MIIPGLRKLKADVPVPFFGSDAAPLGRTPVAPSVKPIVALPPSFEITTAGRQLS
jgi:hypothetical protein